MTNQLLKVEESEYQANLSLTKSLATFSCASRQQAVSGNASHHSAIGLPQQVVSMRYLKRFFIINRRFIRGDRKCS